MNESMEIRMARQDDMKTVLCLIKELCVFQKEPETSVTVTEEDLIKDCFGSDKYFNCLIAEWRDKTSDSITAVGYAVYCKLYSTWKGRILYVEDIFVKTEYRDKGVGSALMKKLCEIGIDADCARLEWSCLDWNEPALEFYRRIGSDCHPQWLLHHFTRVAMEKYIQHSKF